MKKYIVFLILAIVVSSCEDFLNQNPDNSFTTFETVDDAQGVLDDFQKMNVNYPAAVAAGADSYYVPIGGYENLPFEDYFRSLYIWKGTDYNFGTWSAPYESILSTNVALDALTRVSIDANSQEVNKVKGGALFFRSFYFFSLSQMYIPPYDEATAASDLGLPLRTTPDPEVPSERSSVQETYDRILADFQEAVGLLPDIDITTSRPSKAAAYGMLARTFLAMGKYDSALVNADRALQIKSDLIDYNSLDSTASVPIPQFNKEEIFYAVSRGDFLTHPFYSRVDTTLYNSYNDNDLRKAIFFTDNTLYDPGTIAFKGSYSGLDNRSGTRIYGGIATDEMYLIRAECHARTGDINSAMQDLNTLLEKRWKDNSSFIPVTATDQTDAITKIIAERRKELLFRGHRWTDIRRLAGTDYQITPKRVINGQEYILSSDNPETRYTFLIPSDVIDLGGIQQNE